MSVRRSKPFRLLLLLLTLACLGGAGYLGYVTFFAPGSAAKQFQAADGAYSRGLAAYEQKNWDEAATRFDEALLQANKANDLLDAQTKEGKLPAADAQELQGRIMWVKARAIRDHAYAKAQAAGAPLPDVPDPQYNETYRAYTAIPDPKTQTEALNSLRFAEARLGSDPDVIKDALRYELILPHIQWHVAEPLLRKSLELNKGDARANYYLARFEYEQPADERGTPSPLPQRSAERMDKALELLAGAKRATPPAPYWRTVGLEADILDWPLRTAVARKLKPDAVAAAEKPLDQVLFDPQAGAVAAVSQPGKLAAIGNADALGLVSVLATAYERAMVDLRKPGGSPERLKLVARAALDLANHLAAADALKVHLLQVAPVLLQIASGAQGQLAKANPAAWQEYSDGIDAVLAKSPDAVKNNPTVRLSRARIALADAAAADAARAKAFMDRAVKELEEGLKAATDAKSPPAVTDEFHVELAERKLQSGAKADQIEPHLVQMRASALPRVKLLSQLFDALLAERQGRLEKARQLLQTAAADRANPDIAFRANVFLANVSAAVGDWAATLGALKDVEARYKSAALPAAARVWADERLSGAEGVAAALVEANLNVAVQVTLRYRRENPNKPLPADLVSGYVTSAEALVKTLRTPSGNDRTARMALARYYLLTNRRKEADARFDALAIDYPDSVDVLRVRCQLLAAPTAPGVANPKGVEAADLLIKKFVDLYPASKAARLFNAEWLIRTSRADKAIDYLENPATFPDKRDPAVDRLLAAALFQRGQGAEAQKLLSRLPADPLIDAVLIQAAISREAGDKQLKEAMGRYENQGLFRIYEAALRLGEGKYEESIREFASAAEFTQYGNAARAGMRRALFAYADAEPAKARDLAVRLAAEMPDEPGVYLGTALAALLMDDIGAPEDKWDNAKTMYAAVNRWEAAALKAGAVPADVVVAKAQFRLLAGDVVGARQEANAGLARYPKHVSLMLMLAELSLAPPADSARAREFLNAATKENPNDPRLLLIDALIRSAAGETVGDLAKAAATYEKLIAEAPRNGVLYALLVTALETQGKNDDALRWARDWAARFPEDNRPPVELIRLLTKTGKKDEAVKAADELVARRAADARKAATAATPAPPPADVEKAVAEARGTALSAASSGFYRAAAYDEAEVRTREILKTFPDAVPVRLTLGEILVARKEWDAAVPVYADLLKTNRRNFVAGNNLAWILAEKKNDPVAALAIVTEIRKARDGDRPVGPERLPPDFLDTIGVIYTKLNQADRYPEMRATFEAAVARYPADPRMRLYLGHALAALGDRSKAREAFDAAVRLAGVKNNNLRDEQNKAIAAAAEEARKKLVN